MREQNESLFRRPMMERKKMQQKFVSMLGKSCSQHSSGFYKIWRHKGIRQQSTMQYWNWVTKGARSWTFKTSWAKCVYKRGGRRCQTYLEEWCRKSKFFHKVSIVLTLHVFLNGWKEVLHVLYVNKEMNCLAVDSSFEVAWLYRRELCESCILFQLIGLAGPEVLSLILGTNVYSLNRVRDCIQIIRSSMLLYWDHRSFIFLFL